MKPDMLQWVQLAVRYGPFFFSILFLAVVVRWAHKTYHQVTTRQNPPASKQEIETYQWTFIVSSLIGVALVFVSVAWWLKHPPGIYVFRAQILNLKSYESLDSGASGPDTYFRPVPRSVFPGDETPLRNMRFIAVQLDAPFKPGQMIPVDFCKGQGKRVTFQIEYTDADSEPSFVVEWNEEKQQNELKRVQADPRVRDAWLPLSLLISSAYAEHPPGPLAPGQMIESGKWSGQAVPPSKIPMTTFENPATASPATVNSEESRIEARMRCTRLVDVLQNPLSEVGSKIASIEDLGRFDEATFRECATSRTDGEPTLVTLLDLTRHSDAELASKARRVLARFDVDSYLVQKLKSQNAAAVKEAELVLLRLDKKNAERVLKDAGSDQIAAQKPLLKEVASNGNARIVRPSGSSKGDQYFVKATWDPQRTDVVTCLTGLFNRELANSRTPQQEAALMAGRKDRVVYWYDKQWAIGMATKIESCGGQAQFVSR